MMDVTEKRHKASSTEQSMHDQTNIYCSVGLQMNVALYSKLLHQSCIYLLCNIVWTVLEQILTLSILHGEQSGKTLVNYAVVGINAGP